MTKQPPFTQPKNRGRASEPLMPTARKLVGRARVFSIWENRAATMLARIRRFSQFKKIAGSFNLFIPGDTPRAPESSPLLGATNFSAAHLAAGRI